MAVEVWVVGRASWNAASNYLFERLLDLVIGFCNGIGLTGWLVVTDPEFDFELALLGLVHQPESSDVLTVIESLANQGENQVLP